MTVWDCVVVGGTLAGMAAAARLAKNRHSVLVLEAEGALGGSLAPHPGQDEDVLLDRWPQMLAFPAPWRDLFRKSGRAFDDELARAGHALVPAPAPRHVFADGAELVLPTERGVQFSVLGQTYGRAVAERWRDLVDHLDEVAQALRPLGGEAELVSYDQVLRRRSVLTPTRTVADLARGLDHPHLATLVEDTARRIGSDPERTPGWVAVQLSNERRFGRWMMTTDDRPDRASLLLDLLVARLRTRRVEVRTGAAVTAVGRRSEHLEVSVADDEPVTARTVVLGVHPGEAYRILGRRAGAERRRARRSQAALAPVITHEVTGADGNDPAPDAPATDEAGETVHHGPDGPRITWTRPLADGRVLHSVHDWTRAQPSPGAGIAWQGAKSVMRRPPIRSEVDGVHLAGPFSRGGEDLSHVVLSGALASYACHERLQQS